MAQLTGAVEYADCFFAEVWVSLNQCPVASSAGAVEYTDCFSAEGLDSYNECPEYDTKQSDSEALVMLKLWWMWSTPLLLPFPGLLWPRVVIPDKVLSMGQIELNCVLILNWVI